MKKAPIPFNEAKRIKALLDCDILDSEAESSFDQITQLAAQLFDVPVCLISLVDSERQWFKSRFGLEVTETPRDISFCGHVVEAEKTMVVSDADKDERFNDNPLVTGDLGLKFYAGAPVVGDKGYVFGTLCLIDFKTRDFSEDQVKLLNCLARQTSELIRLHVANSKMKTLLKENRDIEKITNAGAWYIDLKNEELFWSEGVYDIYKIPSGTPTNRIEAMSYYAEHEQERIKKCVDDCIKLYKPFDEEFEFVDAEGVHKWVRAHGEPVLSAGGELIRVAGAFQDITVLKRREVALQRMTSVLKESNNRLGIALDSIEMGVWDWNLKENTLTWDVRMFKIFGEQPNNNMTGNLIWQKALHPDDHERIHESFELCIGSKKKDYRENLRIVLPNGEVRNLVMVAKILYDDDNEAVRAVGVNWDVTEEVQRSEELSNQRKMTHHNAKLAAIGELAAGVAHEINNPLTIINGFIGLLGKNLETGKWDKARMLDVVKKIEISTERIAKIVKGLRNFSRVDKEMVSHFDIVETIDETISMLLGIYHKEGVQIEFDFDRTQKVMIQGNQGKLQQVLINLISNAKDATEGQEARQVDVRLDRLAGRIRLQVHDNGPGIAKDLRERVFEPFFTTKDVNKGTGIGLSLVHSIVSEHKGLIRIEDSDESGATFTVELPEVRETQAA